MLKLISVYLIYIMKLRIQGSRFTIVGITTATLDFITLYVLTDFAGLGYFISAAIGFIFGTLCNYVLSIKWVFIAGKYKQSIELTFFILTSLIGLIINQFVMWLFVGVLLINYLVAKCASIMIVAIWNFVSKKKFVFVN